MVKKVAKKPKAREHKAPEVHEAPEAPAPEASDQPESKSAYATYIDKVRAAVAPVLSQGFHGEDAAYAARLVAALQALDLLPSEMNDD